jgi:hypothetical protein
MPHLAPLLTGCIVLGYVASLWWLLRHEPATAWVGIVGLSAVSLALRLYATTEYPAGLNEDEATVLGGAIHALASGNLFAAGPTGVPNLLTTLFEAQFVPWLGVGRWAIRTYSMTTSVLSVPATYALARALRLRVVASLAAAAFVAVLPWSIFYGRVHQGGEVLFHQLLLLAALARLIWAAGGLAEVGIGALGLCLLFHGYFSGRAMLGMPLVAAVLARGWKRRLLCVAIPVVAFFGWLPHVLAMHGHPYTFIGLSLVEVHPDYEGEAWKTLTRKVGANLAALAWPVAQDGWLTIRHAAVHPWLVLGLAVIGSFTGLRRALFLWAGFLAGLAPSVMAHGTLLASTHRMQTAYPFIAVAAACALDLVKWRIPCALVSAAVVAVVGVQSVRSYFSPDFWWEGSRWIFDWERTGVVEAIPEPPPPRVVSSDLGNYIAMRSDLQPRVENLSVENWIPSGPWVYVFGARAEALQAFYLDLLGPTLVRQSGRAFSVQFDSRDWSWLRQHGWSYEARCGDAVLSGQVPTLFHLFFSFRRLACEQPVTHTWRGTWLGPAARLRFRFSGHATIETSTGFVAEQDTPNGYLDFPADPGTAVTVRLVTQPNVLAVLYDVSVSGIERLPYWESVAPRPVAGGQVSGPAPAQPSVQ